MPSVGLYFGVYSYCKRVLIPFFDTNFGPESKYQLPSRLVFSIAITSSAGIGNTIASFSRVPYEVVKQNLQTGMYTSTRSALSTMAKEGGLRAFFPLGGIAIQMVRDIPYAMVTLLSYEMLRESVAPLKERYPEGIVDAMTGALAGGLGSYVTNPLDVIKTRMQTDPALYAGSISMCAQATFQEGGAAAFLRGSVPRLMHKIPANGAFFLFYEFFQNALGVDRENRKS
jgi:solute carrier family 25 S-adenosylmethionine transporter 26